ncbi:LacI family DNA-binding transcriptional regulator [Paenibacillus validus]|uniref:LacI family DNA-binding transcriptional regulator n=1 Tax=Paenibacillus validus TaxID=44253 RepID=UPI000FDC19B3|nr:LacI family DNA-binding transcriptional regulator [Paenibacillus validus]MED4602822.1 LacI family DNA-binding transcriptional regulator [Paenibacillus validus]MED4607336.1 LacI family DNA-binding transcriptional regulator [Paenibacillus validus]
MRITIDDVAKQAGVSKTTVSRILNGNYSQTTEETKERVQKIIRELNYHPNPMARGLKQMRTNIIGIVLSNLNNPFWAKVLEGVEDTCRLSGYSLMICNSNEDSYREAELIEGFRMRQVDGIIVNPTANNKALFEEMANNKYPLTFINRRIEGIDVVDSVVVNNINGARMAVDHFVQLGKRNIVTFVYQPHGVSTWQDRVTGFKEALSEHGIAVHDRVIEVKNEVGRVKEAVIEYFKSSSAADAVFSTSSMMTLEILEGFKELNIKVPDDVALIGYDETVWAKHLNPPLTTIKQPAYEMGAIAAKNMIKKITSKTKKRPKTVVLEPELIVRHSCGSH